APNAGNISQQTPCSRRHSDAGHLRDHVDGPADDSRVQRALRCGNKLTQLLGFRGRYKMSTLQLKLFAHRCFNWGVYDYCLFRRADGSIVETRAGENVLHGLGNVRTSFDKDWNISWSYTKGRLAGRICRAHKSVTARRPKYRGLLMLHQSFRTLYRGCGHAADSIRRQTLLDCSFAHNFR